MANASENDRLVSIDCEMTRLDLGVDELCEITIVVTNFELSEVLDPGFQVVDQAERRRHGAHQRLRHEEVHRSSGA